MGQALIIGHEISQTEVNALFKFRCLIKTPQSEWSFCPNMGSGVCVCVGWWITIKHELHGEAPDQWLWKSAEKYNNAWISQWNTRKRSQMLVLVRWFTWKII